MSDVEHQLTELTARLADTERALAALRGTRRRRAPRQRRLMLALLAGMLTGLTPLALFAANPFVDLNPDSPHNGNIDAIYNAGITTGCNPPVYNRYCPNQAVTREEVASFLARTAGLGGNPPVANALTAVNAQTAQSAQNAGAISGYSADTLGRIAVSTQLLLGSAPRGSANIVVGRVTIAIAGPNAQLVRLHGEVDVWGSMAAPRALVTTHWREQNAPASDSGPAFFSYTQVQGVSGVPDDDHMTSKDWVFIAAPGTHTYEFLVDLDAGSPQNFDSLVLIAQAVPFGSAGGAGTFDSGAPTPAPRHR
ncbi:MAG TPA: hypothetical protein VFU78_08155 [Thermomicrobiales bacterium]|nr:hypothetical protein [Thermomicrobiales bacterium]